MLPPVNPLLQPLLQLLPFVGVTKEKYYWLAALCLLPCFAPIWQVSEAASVLGMSTAVPEESGY